MAKEMNKTKPFGVRFSLSVLDVLEKREGITTPQKALNFLEHFYTDHEVQNQEVPKNTPKSSETAILAPKIKNLKIPPLNLPKPPEGLTGIDLAIWKEENWK